MCPWVLPVIAVIGTAISVAGTVAAAQAQRSAGQQQQVSGEQQAAAYRYNQTVAEQNATLATQSAATDEENYRDRARRVIASGRASIAASGTTGEGSGTDLLAESSSNAELDALTIRYGGAVRANAARSQANLAGYNAGVALQAGAYGAQAGANSANATIVQGASSILGSAGNWYQQFKGLSQNTQANYANPSGSSAAAP